MRKIVGFCALLMALLVSPAMGTATNSFILPYGAFVTLKPIGGTGGATNEFGLGTSLNNLVPLFENIPQASSSYSGTNIGFYSVGSPLDVYMTSSFGGIETAFSADTVSASARTAYMDLDNSLGLGGSIYEKINNTTYVMHLDDARSHDFDDNDNDVLIQISLTPAPEPASLMVMGVGGALMLMRRRRCS